MNAICRLCAESKQPEELTITISDPTLDIKQKLIDCCRWTSFLHLENLPESICGRCFERLEQSYAFALNVEEAQIKLQAENCFQQNNEGQSETKYEPIEFDTHCADDDSSDDTSDCKDSKIFTSFRPAAQFDLKECWVKLQPIQIGECSNKSDTNRLEVASDGDFDWCEKLSDSTAEKNAKRKKSFGDKSFLSQFSKDDCNADGTIKESAVSTLGLKSWSQLEYKCSECSNTSIGIDAHRSHYEAMHPDRPVKYMCFDCPKTFEGNITLTLLTHIRSYHKARGAALRHCCTICPTYFWHLRRRNYHQESHENFKCHQCGKSFHKRSFAVHMRTHERETFTCDICNRTVSSKTSLRTHMHGHTTNRNRFNCDQCGKFFTLKGNLKQHLETVHSSNDDRPFACEQCDRTFKTRTYLRIHQKLHSNAKAHKCDLCEKEYHKKHQLVEHIRIHTGEKPFGCENCGKLFRLRKNLQTHMFIHTGERPYSCVQCDLHFTNWGNHNKHMMRHHKQS